ncbi:MAG: hypothetical protein AAFQ41_17045 [Cyanobacteria bacterium J06623_7]
MLNSLSVANITLILGAFVCPLLASALFIYFLRLMILEIKDKVVKHQQWRATPCPNCIYFNDCRELQCAVHPVEVLTRDAVNCRDFQPIVGIRIHDYKIRKH